MNNRARNLRAELEKEIWDFVEKHNITTIEANHETGYPTMVEDYSDLHDDCFLVKLSVDREYGDIELTVSDDYDEYEMTLDELKMENLEELSEWLKENEEKIVKSA